MKCFLTLWLSICLLLMNESATAQTSWQWGKRGGSIADNGSSETEDVIDMATDPKGNVYVLGKVYGVALVDGHTGISSRDRLTITSWSCNGTFRWTKTLGSGSLVTGESLRTDTLGGVYVSGALYSYPAVAGPAYLDDDSTLSFNGKSMFIAKYDTTGNFKWLKTPEPDTITVGNTLGAIFDMDVMGNGDIYLFCQLKPAGYDNGAFVINTGKLYVLKYNASGVFQNVTPLSITGSGGNGFANAQTGYFKRDAVNGRYYLCGRFDATFGTLSLGTTAITKPLYLGAFDSNGNCLWAKQSNGNPLNAGWISSRVVTDASENIYMGGVIYNGDGWNGHTVDNDSFSSLTVSCPFVVKMDKNGNNIWVNQAKSSGGNNYAGITMTNNTIACAGPYVKVKWGNLLVAQPSSGSPLVDNYLVRINAATGAVIGLDSLKSTFGFLENANAVTSDRNGNFYMGGRFQYDLTVGPNTFTSVGGDFDWFVAKYGSPNCNCTVPVPNFASTSGSGNSFNFNYTGSTPFTAISWNFGDGSPESNQTNPTHTYTTAGSYNVCVTVTNACGSATFCKSVSTTGVGISSMPGFESVTIFPNPATQSITIENLTPGTDIAVYSTTGKCVLRSVSGTSQAVIDISNLADGIYLIRLTDKAGKQGVAKFVKQ